MSLADGFKDALSCWCSGVSVVTTKSTDGLMYGLTVSSFSSLSLDPPLILVCIDNRNRFPAMVEEAGGFAVSILHHEQQAASNYFARPGRLPTPDFTEIEGDWTDSGQPVVKGAMAWLACEVHQQIEAGDHTIVIGRVVETFASEGEPLLYYRRAYRSVAT
ncbi:MAG: flavin reductase family protein [Alphaproteobacteria bacterium]|nr:flavin reductase family protein [Alphaproteobacteria bacterium]